MLASSGSAILGRQNLGHASSGCDTALAMRRRCIHGHVHPPVRVVANTELVERRVSRFYHCPDCVVVRQSAATGAWVEFRDRVEARRAGHTAPCRTCFPLRPAQAQPEPIVVVANPSGLSQRPRRRGRVCGVCKEHILASQAFVLAGTVRYHLACFGRSRQPK